MLWNNSPVVYDTKTANQSSSFSAAQSSCSSHTFIASTTVLIIINEKMAYSNGGDVTNHQIFNCVFFTGIYRLIGLAFNANSMHLRQNDRDRSNHLPSISSYLILIQFTISIFLFTFVLKSNDDETDENIDHKKGNDLKAEAYNTAKYDGILTMINAMK